jgi:cell division protein FtsB
MPPGQRDNLRSRKLLLVLLSAMAVALLYGILFGNQGIPRFMELRTTFVERSAEVYKRVERNSELRHRLNGLRSSDEVLAEAARLNLGMVDEDEIVYVFRPQEPDRRP